MGGGEIFTVFIIVLEFIGIPISVILIIRYIIKSRRRKKKYNQAYKEQEKYTNKNYEQITSLGNTPQEREIGIHRLFDEKSASIFYIETDFIHPEINGKKNKKLIFGITKYSRNIASFNNKEREFLRIVFLLNNYKGISLTEFLYPIINSEKKANVESFPSAPSKFDFHFSNHHLINQIEPEKIDNVINKILQIVENLPNNDPIKIKINNRLRGGGIWLGEQDIENSAFVEASNYTLKIGNLHESNHALTYSGEGSLITIAPPGSGKTQCFVLPNMLHWQGAAFVLDIKGEIYSATHEWRSKNVGKVYKFSPLDPGNSHSYNPLVFIRQDPDFLWEDSRFLADMMIVPSGGSDPFWENMARDIVTSAIAYVCFQNEPLERPMSKVLDIIYGIGFAEMVVDLKLNDSISAMRQMGHSLFEIEKKTIDSVLKTAQSCLSTWQGERINRVTKKSDWSPLDLRNEKATVYICINPNEIDSYLSLLRVLIAQHIRMLTSSLPERGAAPILFMLDELPRLKKMLPVEEALNIGRQYGIKLWMFAQSYGQLKQAYPNVEGFLGSCAVRTFMNIPLNDEIAEKISNQLGYRESPLDNSRHKMVEPLELAGPEYKDIAIVLASNTKPARVKKSYAWQDEELKERMKV